MYITERLGTSQQFLIDGLAARLEVAQQQRQRPRRRPPSTGDHGPADRPVDHPIGGHRQADPRRRSAGHRTHLLTERIPVLMITPRPLLTPRAAPPNSRPSPTAKPLDVIVIGGGITGAGIALDAASRGLRVALVEKHDLAFGTSRWSSKLVHGGLRYLATGNVGIARRSAIERGILMTATPLTWFTRCRNWFRCCRR